MSTGAIFVLNPDGHLAELNEVPYENEALLQDLLEKHPNLLAGNQMGDGPARRWLLVAREMPVMIEEEVAAQGRLDHLFLDQDAIPTLVEVKRSSDMRIRREVVGQMLDYAANAARYWPVERMRARFESRFREDPGAADITLADFLAGEDPEDFWDRAATNLQAGKVRLVFVADVIPQSLRAIIEFLNGQMKSAEVLGVEVRQYVGQGIKSLVPRVVGVTAASERRGQAEMWTLPRFRTRLREKRGDAAVQVADRIVEWAGERMPDLFYGRGTADGAIVPRLWVAGQRYLFFALYSYGAIELSLQWMKSMPGFEPDERRLEFLQRINSIPGVSVPADAITRRPSFPILLLQDDAARRAFFAVIEWAIGVARAVIDHRGDSESSEDAARGLAQALAREK